MAKPKKPSKKAPKRAKHEAAKRPKRAVAAALATCDQADVCKWIGQVAHGTDLTPPLPQLFTDPYPASYNRKLTYFEELYLRINRLWEAVIQIERHLWEGDLTAFHSKVFNAAPPPDPPDTTPPPPPPAFPPQ
jgi:hypothetical protein